MKDIQPMHTFLEDFKRIIAEQITAISELIKNNTIKEIADDYFKQKSSYRAEPFNVFKLASDRYYRENFHSDIIKAFLNPEEGHGEGCLFLYAFIDFIKKSFPKISISKTDYKNVIVKREAERIDILIKSEESKHCIIIENKIGTVV
jgi:hypothetical protein